MGKVNIPTDELIFLADSTRNVNHLFFYKALSKVYTTDGDILSIKSKLCGELNFAMTFRSNQEGMETGGSIYVGTNKVYEFSTTSGTLVDIETKVKFTKGDVITVYLGVEYPCYVGYIKLTGTHSLAEQNINYFVDL